MRPLIDEQAGGGYRQEVDVKARSHEEELCQAIDLSLYQPSLPDLDLKATSESESESESESALESESEAVEDVLPFCALLRPY